MEVIIFMTHYAREYSLDLTHKVSSACKKSYKVDSLRVQQVLFNILMNAVKNSKGVGSHIDVKADIIKEHVKNNQKGNSIGTNTSKYKL